MLYGSLPVFVPLEIDEESGVLEGVLDREGVRRRDTMDASSMMVHESEEAALRREHERLRSEVEAQQKAVEDEKVQARARIEKKIERQRKYARKQARRRGEEDALPYGWGEDL